MRSCCPRRCSNRASPSGWRAHRPGDAPFDVILGAETAGDGSARDAELVQAYADAGVTWWMEAINHWRGPLSAMRERIRKGPPRPER